MSRLAPSTKKVKKEADHLSVSQPKVLTEGKRHDILFLFGSGVVAVDLQGNDLSLVHDDREWSLGRTGGKLFIPVVRAETHMVHDRWSITHALVLDHGTHCCVNDHDGGLADGVFPMGQVSPIKVNFNCRTRVVHQLATDDHLLLDRGGR